MKKNIAVIFGGRSCEHDISILTALQAMGNLDKKKYEIYPVYLLDGCFYTGKLKNISAFTPFISDEHKKICLIEGSFYECEKRMKLCFKPDVALLTTHGGEGEDGSLQGLLEVHRIPYTSAGVAPSAVCMNKAITKELFENKLLNILKYTLIYKEEIESDMLKAMEKIESVLDYPVIVKPCSLGSSIGIEVARDRVGLEHALSVAACFDREIIVERALVDFVEINCAVLSDGDEIIVGETEQPISWNSFLTYDDKYMSGGKMSAAKRIIPAPVSDEVNNEVKESAKRLFSELNLKGVVRIDYLYDTVQKKLFINEINTIPGSLAFYLFEPLGISFQDLLDKLIKGAEVWDLKKKKNSFKFESQVLKNFSGGLKK